MVKTEDSTLCIQVGLRLSAPLYSKTLEAAKALSWVEVGGKARVKANNSRHFN